MSDNGIPHLFRTRNSQTVKRKMIINHIHHKTGIGTRPSYSITMLKVYIGFYGWKSLHKITPWLKKDRLHSGLKNFYSSAYADNFALPLALLADKTFLPFAVDILFLNPCTLALCLVLGWKVIFPLCIRTPPFYSVWHKPPIVSPGIIRPYEGPE